MTHLKKNYNIMAIRESVINDLDLILLIDINLVSINGFNLDLADTMWGATGFYVGLTVCTAVYINDLHCTE